MATAGEMYRALNGVFCIYKPPGMGMRRTRQVLQTKLSQALNEMPIGPAKRVLRFNEDVHSSLPTVTSVPDLRDNPLVLGKHYEEEDFRLGYVSPLHKHSSGLVVMALNQGNRMLPLLRDARQMRVYHATGELGRATDDHTVHGTTRERTTYSHVTQTSVDRVVSAVQGVHTKLAWTASGVDPQSQEAYEIASRGLLRPKDRSVGAIIYGIKCIHFEPPHFTLEIHTLNEQCTFFYQLIHNMALKLRTTAVCSQLRRIRHGHFELPHTLISKHWEPPHILENIALCKPLLYNKALQHKHEMSPVKHISTSESPPLLEESQRLLDSEDFK